MQDNHFVVGLLARSERKLVYKTGAESTVACRAASSPAELFERMPIIPDLVDLEELKIKGDVRFEGTASLKGKVTLEGLKKALILPSGVVIADESLQG